MSDFSLKSLARHGMAGQKPSSKASKGLLAGLCGLIMVYQVGYQIIMTNRLRNQGSGVRWDATWCTSDNNSHFCVENRLFGNWEARVDADLNVGRIGVKTEVSDQTDGTPAEQVVRPAVHKPAPLAAAVRWNSAASLLDESVSASKDGRMSFVFGSDGSLSLNKEVMSPPPALRSSSTPPAAETETAAVQSEDEASDQSDHLTPWARDLMALEERMEARLHKLQHDHAEVEARHHAEEVARQERHKVQSKKSLRSTHSSDAATHAAADRASLAEHLATYNKGLAHMEAEHKKWEELLTSKVTAFEHDLCADPRRKHYAVCAQFLNESEGSAESAGTEQPATSTAAPRASGFLASSIVDDGSLHWRSVVAWSSEKASPSPKLIQREELANAHWAGKIPKVACVTVIPSSAGAMAYARYFLMNFIENFRAQSYEGPKQLVLVYHSNNTEAAMLVKRYADGTFVKGVGAFGPEEVPSTTAYRYGAWSSDADIVARWDFDAWHHPSRLSMQVKALAQTRRPGCILKSWTVLGASGNNHTETGGSGWDMTLVGETKWMHKFWHPLLPEEKAVLEGPEAGHVVRLEAPELAVYNADLSDGRFDGLDDSTVPDK
eukprot:gnl/TRDRNA2_/TRDRNA2_182550_c0_seq1.p1 gnl/TRDRNA2_/TRDRNA2_182550_c0~~gnl/TRDRNA2_/TRDRNA2_182550_c0_seq1.p1  ORF type:complete len:607 (+),score=120.96 gnl/TRDRNA2_/TRDRNA2_182550_c0_seq1:66-1886(+)